MLNTEPQVAPEIPISSEPLVVLSEAAAGKLQELVTAEQNPDMGLRVYVYSGGCSGFRYGMMLEDQPSSEDVTVESKGIKVYVDRQSTQYLLGSEIDYLDTLMGAGFTVNNPNAVSACGCGSCSARPTQRAARAVAATDRFLDQRRTAGRKARRF